ncbi:MAG: hypothetical protein ACFWTI_11000 [Lactobacillus helveticus]|uniref:Uncharacterized protein n=1 Tax=Lactobacillus helveticus TaxID=1587 RepID=A0A9Q5C578_LACHE|nr:hypothetical protein [Lactobacillus helveticus]NRN83704.1 hypothetical protein [Lactobacillus helveticus]NRN86036.1 hypothetical protein [Lactobacillus helveticus]NRN92490.1 hypothetical protein [Lactobacillus helveticus]NRO00830.1 hypothetical protein [Lactobacillus helveticus]
MELIVTKIVKIIKSETNIDTYGMVRVYIWL